MRVGRFEEIALPRGAFALVYSATAWHWIDPARGYARAHDALVPGGTLALFWNEHIRGDDDVGFFDATQDLYAARRHGALALQPLVADRRSHARDRRQRPLRRRRAPRLSMARRVRRANLRAPARHLLRSPAPRRRRARRLLDGIAALIDTRFGGRIVKHYVADLYVARARA